MLAVISIIIFIGLAGGMALLAHNFSVSMFIVGFVLTVIGTIMFIIVYCIYRVNSAKSKLQRMKIENEMLQKQNEDSKKLQEKYEELSEKYVALEKDNFRLTITLEEARKQIERLEKRQTNL